MNKEKFYILDMFPYPSGSGIHIGHTVGYLATDIYGRYMNLKGYNVFHPFGFDSFGLPTEHYAIKQNKTPQQVTKENINNFKKQLELLNLNLNWENEINTSDPSYYKFTQWIFTILFNSWYNPLTNKAENINTCPFNDKNNYRLAYIKEGEVNWCEELGTVLANEEVIDGKSERGNYIVIKKTLSQWYLRITPYKQRLKDDLENVEWSNKIVQFNWIDKLHDIVFSRQRKWGEPIPIYNENNNFKSLEFHSLPLTVEEHNSFVQQGGESDTQPSFAGSNWYFFRYLDPFNDNFFCDKQIQNIYLPVDIYVGGSEHNTGHILYARFITKVLYDLGYSVVSEPFKKIINVGLMMGDDGQKMSKSKGNVIIPDDIINKYGIDAYRLWICFIAPFEQTKIWKENGIKGCVKFLKRLETLLLSSKEEIDNKVYEEQKELILILKKQIGKDIENFSFNTAIPKLMTFVNQMKKYESISFDFIPIILNIIEPFCPDFVKKIKI